MTTLEVELLGVGWGCYGERNTGWVNKEKEGLQHKLPQNGAIWMPSTLLQQSLGVSRVTDGVPRPWEVMAPGEVVVGGFPGAGELGVEPLLGGGWMQDPRVKQRKGCTKQKTQSVPKSVKGKRAKKNPCLAPVGGAKCSCLLICHLPIGQI